MDTKLEIQKAALDLFLAGKAETPEHAARLAYEIVEAASLEMRYRTGEIPRPTHKGVGYVLGQPEPLRLTPAPLSSTPLSGA